MVTIAVMAVVALLELFDGVLNIFFAKPSKAILEEGNDKGYHSGP